MRPIKTLAMTLGTMFIFTTPVSAADNDQLCSLYSKIGGTMVEFMLPLTMQDFVNMVSGKDPALMQKMTVAMLSDMSGPDMAAMVELGEADGEIIGQAAGQVSIELLMSGQFTSKNEVVNYMQSSCVKIGADTIIANQKKANSAVSANTGQ